MQLLHPSMPYPVKKPHKHARGGRYVGGDARKSKRAGPSSAAAAAAAAVVGDGSDEEKGDVPDAVTVYDGTEEHNRGFPWHALMIFFLLMLVIAPVVMGCLLFRWMSDDDIPNGWEFILAIVLLILAVIEVGVFFRILNGQVMQSIRGSAERLNITDRAKLDNIRRMLLIDIPLAASFSLLVLATGFVLLAIGGRKDLVMSLFILVAFFLLFVLTLVTRSKQYHLALRELYGYMRHEDVKLDI